MGNSVIYTPAYDAEVEYLESTGTQWIDTGLTSTSSTIIEVDAQSTMVQWQDRFVGNSTGYLEIYISGGLLISFAYNNKTLNTQVPSDTTRHTLKIDNYNAKAYIDGSEFDIECTSTYGTITILSRGVTNISKAKLYSAKIWNGNTLIRNFIPVRIGSVGYMYDKVTKQLFANKGTGNFILGNDVSNAVIPQQRCVLYFGNQRSVGFERIYEEYEWLKGDRAATLYLGNYNDKVEFDCRLNVPSVTYGFIYGYNGVLRTLKSDNYNEFRTEIAENRITSISPIPVSDLHVSLDFNNHNVYVNETKICYTDKHSQEDAYGNEQAYKQAYFFGSLIWESFNSDGLLGNVIADGKSFIPCKLLQSIPAILDGNGIARQAGECGMWDKVSNKFYGNVANSGTFTVKGPKCYEEYKWLNCYTADGATLPAQGADIGITPISLTNKVLTIELGQVSRNVIIHGNSPYFIPMWCMYVNNMYVMQVQERKGNDNTIHNMTYNWTTSNTIILDFINNVATLGNSTFQIEGTKYTFRGFNSSIWQNPRTVGRIKISDELDLVPCKLTHGIPASMDANGIARPAGTCGMWDKVNDKFYGNVASSGSFTVSN